MRTDKQMLNAINSQGKVVSQQHLDEKEQKVAYMKEIGNFLDRTRGQYWTQEIAGEYKELLKKHGMI